MTNEKRLYRSCDAVIAGVCAGISDYCSVDPLVVRILITVLFLVSCGLSGIIYLIFWIVIPNTPKVVVPLDIQPYALHSYTYGIVDCSAICDLKEQRSSTYIAAPSIPESWRRGVAHTPPEPPLAAQLHCFPQSQFVTEQSFVSSAKTASGAGVRIALCVGCLLLFLGFVSTVTFLVQNTLWWQYWPLILVIVGILRMIVPGQRGRSMREFTGGFVCFFLGWLLLAVSLGLIAQQSVVYMAMHLWPLLLVDRKSVV